MSEASFLAIDLGAESGRAILGNLQNNRLILDEVHRFPNLPVNVGGHIHWDILRLYSDILQGLRLGGAKTNKQINGIGIDTWGVDFGLLDKKDQLIGNPYHYRDARTNGMVEEACKIAGRTEIYAQTGIQFMQLNTLYQLLAMRQANDPALEIAHTFLNIPDLLNFWLCGQKASEFTIASTTQCYNPTIQNWAWDLLKTLKIPTYIFQCIQQPGTVLDNIRDSVASEVGIPRIPLIAVGSHDTASAVAAVPANTNQFIYISSGTWSLMGLETNQPIITEQSLTYNLTNEGGVDNKIRFLKNIMGMWLVQECRREWALQGQIYSYDDLTTLARLSPPLISLITPGDDRFLAPGKMIERIQEFCTQTNQAVPTSVGSVIRCILESLALEYRWVAEKLQELAGVPLPVIHIIGGGSRNLLLNQFTADATGCTVVAGPVEATAIGNILTQALALGQINSILEGRELVRQSFDVTTFQPTNRQVWDDAYQRFRKLANK